MAPPTAPPPPDFVGSQLTDGADVKLLTLAILRRPCGGLVLGLKKRGFGAGYINGFGGKVEAGESVAAAAAREVQEESGVAVTEMRQVGLIHFVFDDQPRPWETHVFEVTGWEGDPSESDEMAPLGVAPADLDYSKMWADDRWWYPLFLAGTRFQAIFAFTGTTALRWHALAPLAEGAPFEPSGAAFFRSAQHLGCKHD